MSGKPSGHRPRAASVQARTDGGVNVRTKSEKVLDLGTAPAPLFPVAQPNSAPYPAVYFRDFTVILRDAEVPHPATEILGQLEQPVLHGDPPASSGVLLDAASEFPVCLVRPDDAGSAEDETEKVDAGCSCYRTLGFIDRKLEFVRQEGFHAFHHAITGTLTLHENDKVVSVADKLVTACLKLFVQCVEQDVGKERRERPTLGNTQTGLFQSPVHLHPGSQVPADQG